MLIPLLMLLIALQFSFCSLEWVPYGNQNAKATGICGLLLEFCCLIDNLPGASIDAPVMEKPMENKRSIFAIIFGTILTLLYAYQIIAAWINAEPVNPLWAIGLACGMGLVVAEAINIRKKK